MKKKHQEKDPSKTMRTADKLLEKGDTGMAATYFWCAGNGFREMEKYEMSGLAYEKAAHCYELDGRWDKAADDYLSASEMYDLAGSPTKAKAMRNIADDNKEKMRKK